MKQFAYGNGRLNSAPEMKTQGVRISDSKDDVLLVSLADILEELPNSTSLYWSILFLDGTPIPGEGKNLRAYQDQINRSTKGTRESKFSTEIH